MTEEMFQQISKITDKREIPISQYIREVLKDRLNQTEGINEMNKKSQEKPIALV
jgi:hypothetical protein